MWLGVDPLWEKYAGMNPYNYCAGNPVGLVDVDGREPDERTAFNFDLPELVATVPGPSNPEVTFYKNHSIPVGENYINYRERIMESSWMSSGNGYLAKGGCTYASAKSILDFFNVNYNKKYIERYRQKKNAAGIFNIVFYNALKGYESENSMSCEVFTHTDINEILLNDVRSMKSDGTAFALTHTVKDGNDIYGHTVVVRGFVADRNGKITGFSCWDNAGSLNDGCLSVVPIGDVSAVYKVKKNNYNPWISVVDIKDSMNRYLYIK